MKALITGASSGIGRDMARGLARRGYDLILVARRTERLEELGRTLPVQVQTISLDLAQKGNCRALYEQVKDQDLDILINNAGRGLFGPFDETDLEEELAMLDINIRCTHILTKLFLPDFKRRNKGHILNVASSAAFLPGPLLSSYYASKAYVLRLSEAISEELRRAGSQVKISVLCPGPVRTEFNDVAGVRFSIRGLPSPSVAEYAIERMLRGRLVIVPGLDMKLAHLGAHLAPDQLLLRICWHMQKRKQGLIDARGRGHPAAPPCVLFYRKSSFSLGSNWTPSIRGVPAASVLEAQDCTNSTARLVAMGSCSPRRMEPSTTEAKRSPVPENCPFSCRATAKRIFPVRQSRQAAPTVLGAKLTPVITTERRPSRDSRASQLSMPA